MHQSCLLLRRLLECWQLGYVGIHRINLKTFGTTKTMMKHFLLSPFAFGMVVRRSNFRGKRNYGSSTREHFCRLTGRLQNRCHWSHITLRYDMICLITHLEGVASQTTWGWPDGPSNQVLLPLCPGPFGTPTCLPSADLLRITWQRKSQQVHQAHQAHLSKRK